MFSRSFQAIFLALSICLSIVSCAPFRPFTVDADGRPEANNTLLANKLSKRLTLVKAINGPGTTEPLLKMRQFPSGGWNMTGLLPKEVLGFNVEDAIARQATSDCRGGMSLDPGGSFIVTVTDTLESRKACWDKLTNMLVPSSTQEAFKDFDIKKLGSIYVENAGGIEKMFLELF